MSIDEILALESGIYSMLIEGNKFNMRVCHDAKLANGKVTFWYNYEDNIHLFLECSTSAQLILVTTFNNVNFVRIVENDNLKFESDEDDLYYNILLKSKNEYSY